MIEALKDVEGSLSAYFNEQQRLFRLEAQVEDLKRTRDLALIKYEAGLESMSTYLDAQAKLLIAVETTLQSEQALSQNLMRVYKSLGGEWSCCNTP